MKIPTPLEAVIELCYSELDKAVPWPSSDYQDGRWDMARAILKTLNLPTERPESSTNTEQP